jgi:hypothetical protein
MRICFLERGGWVVTAARIRNRGSCDDYGSPGGLPHCFGERLDAPWVFSNVAAIHSPRDRFDVVES